MYINNLQVKLYSEKLNLPLVLNSRRFSTSVHKLSSGIKYALIMQSLFSMTMLFESTKLALLYIVSYLLKLLNFVYH